MTSDIKQARTHLAEVYGSEDSEKYLTRCASVATAHALLAIHDLLDERLPKPKPIDHTIAARNLEAFKHAVSKPMREHGECCEPAEVTKDQPVGTRIVDCDEYVWERREDGWHIWSGSAWGSRARAVAHLSEHFAPLRLATPADLARVGIVQPAPADDLPGEPVEPGDLRAGDVVAFTYDGERIQGPLVRYLSWLSVEMTDHSPISVRSLSGQWEEGISDVRLIERAPREDEDQDEALARVLYETECEVPWEDAGAVARDTYRDLARAARKHVEAEQEDAVEFLREEVESLTRRADGYRAEALQYGRAALDRAKERDGWKAKHAALREDVEALRRNPKSLTDVLMRAADILDSDDARDPQAD